MSDFYTAFVRPLFPGIAVGSFLLAGGAGWIFGIAAFMAMYMTFLEIGRQGGWK